MHTSRSSAPFSVKSTNEDFIQRQKNVFDQLNSLGPDLRSDVAENMDTDETPSRRTSRSITKQFRGKESIFKRPEDPIRKNYMKNIPDFKKNPHKWKKYSLADVKDEDMSETSNTKTALSFLNELKNRHQSAVNDDISEEPKKIVFRKTSSCTISKNDEEAKPSFRSSKVVMPEYVVGKKISKEKKHKHLTNTKISQLKLEHLDDVIDE